MKKFLISLFFCFGLSAFGQTMFRNSLTTNSDPAALQFGTNTANGVGANVTNFVNQVSNSIVGGIVGPTNGVTAITATNIAIFQAQVATNQLQVNLTPQIPGIYNPSNSAVIPGLVGWWRVPALTGTYNNGDSITSFIDSSGSGATGFAVGAGANPPVFKTNIVNGLPAMFYTQAGGTHLTISNFFNGTFNNSFTYFIVRIPTKTNFFNLMLSAAETSGNWYDGLTVNAGGCFEDFTSVNSIFYDSSVSDPTNIQVVAWRYGTDYCEQEIGDYRVAHLNNPPPLGLSGDLLIGSRPGFFDQGWEGYICEMLIFKRALSRPETALVRTYLRNTWGIKQKAQMIADGASLTAGFKASQWGAYPALMRPVTGDTLTYDYINLGIPGQQADQILSNAPTVLYPFMRTNSGFYLYWCGDNDLAAPGSTVTVPTMVSNVFYHLDQVRGLGDWKISVGTFLPGNRGPAWEGIRTNANAAIRSNAVIRGYQVQDMGADPIIGVSNNFPNPLYFAPDGTHLTTLGDSIVSTGYAIPFINGLRGSAIGAPGAYLTNAQSTLIALSPNPTPVVSDLTTNANFAFVGFTGLAQANYQYASILLTNTSGSLINFTVPVNCHTNALSICNCTNVTRIDFLVIANRWTNAVSIPYF